MNRFRLLRQINTPESQSVLGHRGPIDERSLIHFSGDDLASQFARALGRRKAVPMKEVLESFEFFAAVRREVRSRSMADLCAGHGLVGVLFALYERDVERVLLVDFKPPASRAAVLEAAAEVGPWTADKLECSDARIEEIGTDLDPETSVVSVHACGGRTDRCIEIGMELRGPIAVMPCCRSHKSSRAPRAVANAVGFDLAIDIDRTYRMNNAGYKVRWTHVPEAITPMNRVLVGRPAS
ncbi:MAG: hypothetical protein ACI8X5_000226 [Planctomycetota bacterium]|jgi:hypothetical protein